MKKGQAPYRKAGIWWAVRPGGEAPAATRMLTTFVLDTLVKELISVGGLWKGAVSGFSHPGGETLVDGSYLHQATVGHVHAWARGRLYHPSWSEGLGSLTWLCP